MAQLYRIIVHAADGAYYQEGPVTFADAQIMVSVARVTSGDLSNKST